MTDKLTEAITLFNSFKFDEAKIAFYKILEIDTKNTDAKMYLGKIHMKYSEHGKALGIFNQIIEFEPNNKEAKTNVELIKSILNLSNNYYYENPYTDDELYDF